jgi:GNAT superfamily N-acetyltransferase
MKTTFAALAADDQQIVQNCFDATHQRLQAIGLAPTFGSDLNGWVEAIERSPHRVHINTCFHPAHSDVTAENAFWIRLTDVATDQTVACIATRLIVTDDYLDEMRSMRLWFRNPPPIPIDIVPDSLPLIAGRVGIHGGLLIHPDWRKQGLSGYLTRLARCGSLRRWAVDWHCGLVFAALAEKGLPTAPVTGYGYPRMALVINGRQPATPRTEKIYVPWISRAEILTQLVEETVRLVANRDQEAVRLPTTS